MVNRTCLRRSLTVAAVVALSVALVENVEAQQRTRRARLSADLTEHVSRGSAGVDVIVRGTPAEIEVLAARYNVRVKRHLRSGAVLQVTGGQLAAIQDDGAQDHISSDAPIRSSADVTAETIGADQVWEGVGALSPLNGAGVGVVVIDSGVDRRHVALRNRVVASVDFTGGDGVDRYGHGTHVAATIAGRAGRMADMADFRGIASGAHIVSLRVLGDDGSGVASYVIEAIDWAIDHQRQYNIRVMNLSLGAAVTQPCRDDPLCEAVDRALDAGIVVVASAGNHGVTADGRRIYGGVTSPGNHPGVITVGALDTRQTSDRTDDGVATWSSRGPTMYDLVMKPDLVAPGSRVTSAEAAGSYLSTTFPQRHVAGAGTSAYMQLSGTSMAAGVVSGAAALLLEGRPRLTPRETKLALQITSSFLAAEGVVSGGAGSLSVNAAARAAQPTGRIAGRSRAHFWSGRARGRHNSLGVWATTIIWGQDLGDTIIWGQSGDTIIWGQSGTDTIIWGQMVGDTIIWGQMVGDTIIWGQSAVDTIIWGQNTDTIIWGQSLADTIIWGQNTADTIIWGQASDDTIIWGQNTTDTIIWGQATGDTIIWGQGLTGFFD